VAAVAPNIDIGMARRMKQYSEYNQVKHALLMRLAQQCTPNELMGLQRQFSLLDKNGDGSLSLDEVTQALRQFRTGNSGQRVYTDEQIAQVHICPACRHVLSCYTSSASPCLCRWPWTLHAMPLLPALPSVQPCQDAVCVNRNRFAFSRAAYSAMCFLDP
jgi:hypothetical protein